MSGDRQDQGKGLVSVDSSEQELGKNDPGPDEDAADEPEIDPNAEVLKKLPPDVRKVVEIGMSMQRVGPMPNPLTDKLNEKHIDKILDISAKSDERLFADSVQTKWFVLGYVVLFLVVFIFLTIFLVGEDKELYKEAVKSLAIFLGGFGGGFGVKSYMDRNRQ